MTEKEEEELFMAFINNMANMKDITGNDSIRLYEKTLEASWRHIAKEVRKPVRIVEDENDK